MVRPLFFWRLLFVAGTAALGVAACGGQQFVAGNGDGGASSGSSGGSSGTSSGTSSSSGGSSGGSSGAEAGACAAGPADGGEAAFCALETKLVNYCQECSACRQTDLDNCAALGDTLSAPFKDALDSCQSQVLCGDYSTYGSNPCVAAALTNSTKTNAQIEAASAFCTRCEPTNTNCTVDYFQPPQTDGGSAGPGYIVLLGNDATASAVQTSCTPGGTSVGLTCTVATVDTYVVCAVAQFCKTQPKEACTTGGVCQ